MRRVRLLALHLASAAACQLATDFTLAPVAETTEELCADGRDNDFNGLGDCQDWSCQGTVRCCDIPELLLEDDFAGGPACADAACAGQTCASPTCGPDDSQWATWPCPFAKVCDGALHFDKEECFAAGAVSEKSVALTPGLLVEVQLRGAPELRGWLEVALTLQDKEDLVGSLNPCGVQQKVNGFAAVRQVHDPAGWKLVASFQQVDVGTSPPVATADSPHTVAIAVDADRQVSYSLDGARFAVGSVPVPATEERARVALTGLTHTATVDAVRVQAGVRCHATAGWRPARGSLESSVVLSGFEYSGPTFDADEVYHPAARATTAGIELYYTGCRWPAGQESCAYLNLGLGRALDDGTRVARDAANPLFRPDDVPGGEQSGVRTEMSIDLVPGPGLRAYVSPASLSPVLLVEDFTRNAGKVTSTNVLPLGAPGEWDQTETCCGTAAVGPDGTTYLWYAGRADTTWQIGLATSPDGATFTRHPQNPVLAPGPPGAFDSASVLGPTVIWDERRRLFRMWYEGRDFFGVTRIGHAVSPDGVAWSRAPDNPALDLDALGAVLIGGPDVLPVGDGRLRMWLHVATQEFYRRRIVELVNDGTNPAGP